MVVFLAQEAHRRFVAQFIERVSPAGFVIERRPAFTLSGDGDRALMVYAERADYTTFSQQRYFPGTPRTAQVGIQFSW